MGSIIEPKLISFKANGAITKDTFVYQVSENEVSTATSGKPIGIAVENAASGEVVNVAVEGGANLIVAAATAVGDLLKPTTSGYGTPVTANNDFYAARAMEAGTASGNVISVIIEKGYYGTI